MNIAARTAAWSGKHLPYDAEVEWIRSDGNAFIETNSLSSDESRISVWLNYNDSVWNANRIIVAAMSNDIESDYTYILLRTYMYGQTYANFASAFNGISNEMPSIRNAKYSIDKSGVYCNDSLVYPLSKKNNIKPANICLFFYRNGGTAPWGKNYIFDISRVVHDVSSNTVMDLVPVRIGDEGAMYDRVSGQLFRNASTGAFVIGPDKVSASVGGGGGY